MKRVFLFIIVLFFVSVLSPSSVIATAGWGESCKYDTCDTGLGLKCCFQCDRCYYTCPNCICCKSDADCKAPGCLNPSLSKCDSSTNECVSCEKCEITYIDCPEDSKKPGETFGIIYGFIGSGPTKKYECRSLWKSNKLEECRCYYDFEECEEHLDTFTVKAPNTQGTYTYTVKCIAAGSPILSYCEESPDSSKSCTVNVVTTSSSSSTTTVEQPCSSCTFSNCCGKSCKSGERCKTFNYNPLECDCISTETTTSTTIPGWECDPNDNMYFEPQKLEVNKIVTIKVTSSKPYPWVVITVNDENQKGPKYFGSSGNYHWWQWEYTPTSSGDYTAKFFVDTTENEDPSKGNKCLEKLFKVEGEGTTTPGTTVGTTMPGTTVGTTVPGGACKLNSVSITVICPKGCCEQNDIVNMEGSISGDCSAIDFFQVDAESSDGACNIEYIGGDMRGISGIITEKSATSLKASWQIPSISSDCEGKSIMGKIAGLYDGGPPGTGTSKTFTTNVGGSFTFCSGPTSTSTTSTSTSTTTTTSSTTTSTTVSTTTSITSTSTTTTITTTSSTVSTTTTMTTTTTQPTTTVSTTTSTTTTIPLVVKFTCSNCESVGNTCTCEVTGCKNGLFGATGIPSGVLEQGIFDIFNFNDYTSTYAKSFDLKKEGILKVGLACVDPMKLEIKEYKVKPEMLTCPSSIAVGDTGVCKVRRCTMGIFIAKGNPLDNDISEIFGGDMDVSMTPSKTGTINVGLGCVNPNAFKFVDITVS